MNYLYCALLGYLIGTVNPSYLLGKLKGIDIRTKGSGNAGASNAVILLGKLVGVLCALFDISKAYFAVYIARALFPDFTHAFAVAGVFCIIGHIFPFYMGFRGGKGLACLAGVVFGFNKRVFLLMLTGAIILALITDFICVVPVTASAVFPVIYGFMTGDVIGALLFGCVFIIIALKHKGNFRRIAAGQEMHLSYLWNSEKEMERMRANLPQDDKTVNEHFSLK